MSSQKTLTLLMCLTALLADVSATTETDADRFLKIHTYSSKDRLRRSESTNSSNLLTKTVTYKDGDLTLTGYLALDQTVSGPRPVVLILHDWDGRDEFENGKARALAQLGYVGFAVDVYGKVGGSADENRRLMAQFQNDRPLLLKRLQLARQAILAADNRVDRNKVGAIGFCFGGLGVLDMARAGWDLKGAVTFHGSLTPLPGAQNSTRIQAKILVLHGHKDGGIPPSAVQSFEQEMTERNADWQVHVYSNTDHAFTVPGPRYNALSDKRSWQAMKDHFQEVFA